MLKQSQLTRKCSKVAGVLGLGYLLFVGSSTVAAAETGRARATHPGGEPVARSAQNYASTGAASSASELSMLVRTGRVQFVRFEGPAGAAIEIVSSVGVVRSTIPADIGLVVGQPYRLRLSNIPDKVGLTIYPTLRLIGYIMPPANVDPVQYSIPIHFLARDFDEAAEGRLVSNVVYLEDPLTAIPIAFPPGDLPVIDIAAGENVLERASEEGRPIVFMQFGNRVPLDERFEDAHGAPAAYFAPARPPSGTGNVASDDPNQSLFAVGAPGLRITPHSPITPASWETPGAPLMWSNTSLGARRSVPTCDGNANMLRLPFKAHPRMPHDEYLCDGGDQVPYAHFSGHDRASGGRESPEALTAPGASDLVGLDASETVAAFSRPGEKPRLVTSNPVCVYAPRFGLMRSSSASIGNLQVEGPRDVGHMVRRGALESRTSIDQRIGKQPSRAVRGRERLSGVAMIDIPTGMDELRVIAAVHQHEFFSQFAGRIGPDDLGQAEEARLAMAIQAAISWTRVQYPAYTAITEGGGQITGYMQTGEVEQVREPYRKPGELVLRKAANPAAAKQGDIIEFAIYYRNIGERPVENVSIIDSLTARLEYVPASAKSDRVAVFDAQPNDVESHELRWDIRDSIPGGQGGMVWFKTKVR